MLVLSSLDGETCVSDLRYLEIPLQPDDILSAWATFMQSRAIGNARMQLVPLNYIFNSAPLNTSKDSPHGAFVNHLLRVWISVIREVMKCWLRQHANVGFVQCAGFHRTYASGGGVCRERELRVFSV